MTKRRKRNPKGRVPPRGRWLTEDQLRQVLNSEVGFPCAIPGKTSGRRTYRIARNIPFPDGRPLIRNERMLTHRVEIEEFILGLRANLLTVWMTNRDHGELLVRRTSEQRRIAKELAAREATGTW